MDTNAAATPYNAAVSAVPMPERIRQLPVSAEGFPVPWFVAWFDGVPDFRVVDSPKIKTAIKHKRCWICGGVLGRQLAFLVGPMCIVNRTISEPPSHRDCAIFAARACPFLANPRMRRNEADLPVHQDAPGMGLRRNPGAVAVWITRRYQPFRPPGGGILFSFPDEPEDVLWYSASRPADRAVVLRSITTGLPTLQAVAAEEGPSAERALAQAVADAMRFLPPGDGVSGSDGAADLQSSPARAWR